MNQATGVSHLYSVRLAKKPNRMLCLDKKIQSIEWPNRKLPSIWSVSVIWKRGVNRNTILYLHGNEKRSRAHTVCRPTVISEHFAKRMSVLADVLPLSRSVLRPNFFLLFIGWDGCLLVWDTKSRLLNRTEVNEVWVLVAAVPRFFIRLEKKSQPKVESFGGMNWIYLTKLVSLVPTEALCVHFHVF